jgi:hypothetical protein
MVQAGADQTTTSTVARVEAAKGVAQAIITQSAEWVSKQVDATMTSALAEMKTTLAAHEERMRSCTQRGMWAAVVACTVALGMTCGMVWFLAA